ncbi:MAG TPA: peptide chain release factor N(5)-glutamine methyltransferase [Gammaproteobacteria bacterium]|jgi:release factor glutamine methyltransferase
MAEHIDAAIRWATGQIAACSESPRLDAELLLAHCLDKPRSYLYSWPEKPLDESCWQCFQQLVRQRLQPMPVAYLLGRREFFSLEYAINSAALVPRPETELLIELALQRIPTAESWRVCDLGTGSGIIAVTVASQRPACRVSACDLDPRCLALARDNADRHGVEVEFFESDWYLGLAPGARFDLILSNPPYIAAGHPFLNQGDLPAEPRLALTPGPTGLEALRTIIAGAPEFLEPGGWLMVEHGYDQQLPVAELMAAAGFVEIRCESDASDLPRASVGRLSGD